ncbi:hypothetical protein F5Y12DRAFT_770332 [Xylaria sp. FL1777]|nr:hypothetical protein F5Y12DRAFT_770332 [Xylaria sp. FL1777]
MEDYIDLVVEVGPHPALKGPTQECLESLTGLPIPYHGTLNRKEHDVVALTRALGFIWEHFESLDSIIKFEVFRQSCAIDHDYRP